MTLRPILLHLTSFRPSKKGSPTSAADEDGGFGGILSQNPNVAKITAIAGIIVYSSSYSRFAYLYSTIIIINYLKYINHN